MRKPIYVTNPVASRLPSLRGSFRVAPPERLTPKTTPKLRQVTPGPPVTFTTPSGTFEVHR